MTLTPSQLAAMTERAFWIAIAPMPQADQLHALTLFRDWRFAATRAADGRPLQCAAPWKRVAAAKAAELQGHLARHTQPITPPPYAAQVNALRALAISAFHRGAIQ
ncbi:hypothetical protein [Swaminathania salitolerans]|uniref:Uncharacterized protein n=1 Tax=Swaminathania salitolerans TaxID=182838 RepID=A0A511BNJ0_9PROT|nr:hypothetical protein [Swaminathania salitolerans]GBQ14796.1 hypothetical protein AA21291_1959 [Swaminathania salitolerans LMG 21291]GEL01891.1 hypothetical protein SSA02_10540 [Swaminathania salitolerans]